MKLKNFFQGLFATLLGFAFILNLGVNSASAAIILEEEGQFTVPANNESGVLITPGLSATDYPSYFFTVEGSWNEGVGAEYSTCTGKKSYPTGSMTYNDEPAFSLVAESVGSVNDGRRYEVCATPDISFVGDDEIKFVMNDAPHEYETNQGSMEVHYVRQ